ncbi:MAG: response regulator [Planctomycetales bacterium]|nr:response regulator [Planctomycetales bacterium]
MANVLVVDDDLAVRDVLSEILFRRGHSVVAARDGLEALSRAGRARFACALADWRLPRLGGRELLEKLREAQPGLPIVVMSGSVSEAALGDTEIAAFLRKPFDVAEVEQVVAAVLEEHPAHEARRFPRKEVAWRAEVRAGADAAAALTRNLSLGGAQVRVRAAEAAFSPGARVEGVLFGPQGGAVRVPARVVWRSPASGDSEARVGLEFLERTPAVLAGIRELL